MANNKITQGEWIVNINNRHDVYLKGGYRIAEVWSGDSSFDRKDAEIQEANTEFIAFAGNLAQKYNLEAIEDCIHALKEALSEITKSYAGHKNPSWIIVNEALNKLTNDSN